ncbi:MAG: hypothetical protein NVS4B5_04870 [Vulcanimicrobiaceae bacterium]
MATHIDSTDDVATILEQLRQSRAATADFRYVAARVAMMNFVVFVDDPQHRQWVLERAAVVADKHPSRLIILDSTQATTGVDVVTNVRESGESTILYERVDVGVSTLDHAAIVTLTDELSVPDIPTVLWWSGAKLLASRTFAGLAAKAQTILVDSSGKSRDEATIAELAIFHERSAHVVLHDLAFMRLAPWQDMIAQFFDDPDLREDIFSLTALEIESGSDAEALYLAGWLGSRLSWTARSRDAFVDRRGTTIPFTKIERGDRRRVRSVVPHAPTSVYRAELSDDDDGVVCLTVEGAKAKRIGCVPLQNIGNTTLIERAILVNAREAIFETSLETVKELLG